MGGPLLLPPTVLPPPRASSPAGPCAGHDPSGQPRGSGAGPLSLLSVTPVIPVRSKPLLPPPPHRPDHAAQDVATGLLFLGPTGAAADDGLGAPAQRTLGQRGLPGPGLTGREPGWPTALVFLPSCPPGIPTVSLSPGREGAGLGGADHHTPHRTPPGEARCLPGGRLQPPWPLPGSPTLGPSEASVPLGWYAVTSEGQGSRWGARGSFCWDASLMRY